MAHTSDGNPAPGPCISLPATPRDHPLYPPRRGTIIGSDRAALPFAHVVDYGKFAGFLSRTSFVKDPRFACEALLHKLRPALPALQRALSDARHWLVYGSVAGGNFSAQTRFGDVAPMLLREVSAAIATGTP